MHNQTPAALKTRAKALTRALAEHGHQIPHGHMLHALAREEGFDNWQAYLAGQASSETNGMHPAKADHRSGAGETDRNTAMTADTTQAAQTRVEAVLQAARAAREADLSSRAGWNESVATLPEKYRDMLDQELEQPRPIEEQWALLCVFQAALLVVRASPDADTVKAFMKLAPALQNEALPELQTLVPSPDHRETALQLAFMHARDPWWYDDDAAEPPEETTAPTHLMTVGRTAFRTMQIAEIVDRVLVPVTHGGRVRTNDCWEVRWPDGVVDQIPVTEEVRLGSLESLTAAGGHLGATEPT